jgi:hypothetical protein
MPSLEFIAEFPERYDYQHMVDSKTTKACYHARMARVFTLHSEARADQRTASQETD